MAHGLRFYRLGLQSLVAEQGEKPCCLKTENTLHVYWLEG
jgi:hypothetical protein